MRRTPAFIAGNLADLRGALRPTALFLSWFALLDLALFGPAAAWLLNTIARTSGQVAISNYDLTTFFLSGRGLLFLALAGSLKLALLFTETGGLTLIALAAVNGRTARVGPVLWQSLTRLPRFAALGLMHLVLAAVILAPFVGAALLLGDTLLGNADINFYLATKPPEWTRVVVWAAAMGITGGGLLLVVLARCTLAIPVVLVEGLAPWQALRVSWNRTRGRLSVILLQLSTWWFAVWGLFAAAAWCARRILEWLSRWAGSELERLLPIIFLSIFGSALFTVAWACLALNGHQWIVTRLYLGLHPGEPRLPSAPDTVPAPAATLRRWRLVVWGVLGIGSIAASLSVVFSLDRMPGGDAVAITAHRGSSLKAPENTLAAIRQAIEDGADFAEIDVQTTRDGHLVIVHDRDLMRVASDPRRIEDLALAQLKRVDVGAKFTEAFRSERVPTLEEAIDLARDRIHLNIELKYNRPDPQLASNVVAFVRARHFANRCVITSLDQSALQDVEALAPELPTGLIVTAVVGDVTKTQADFLSLNSARATPSLVSLAHWRGKEVHVWTVNTEREMLEMIERGVDNIITDDPTTLVAVRREHMNLPPATRLALRLRTLWLPDVPLPSAGHQTPQ